VVEYYTSDTMITCMTPKCYTTACLSDENWQGQDYVQLSVYVETVETILSATTTFTYSGAYTPQIIRMPHHSYGSQVVSLVGRTSTAYTSDLTITIDGQFADLGEDNSLNPTTFYQWSTTSTVYFRTPTDLTAGFLNLSMSSQDDQSNGYEGTGLARMFPDRRPIDYAYDNTYGRNFRTSPAGVPYSLAVTPSVASVFPNAGSLAGGTVISIRGSGFSPNISTLTVFAGGRTCAVLSATAELIVCRTEEATRALNVGMDALLTTDDGISVPSFTAVSSRAYGSSGALVKMWNYYGGHVGDDAYATVFPWRSGFDFSMYLRFGYNWYGTTGLMPSAYFTADVITVLVAPFTGTYQFFINVDDVAQLYGSVIRQQGNESAAAAVVRAQAHGSVLAYATSYQTYGTYYQYASQQSSAVRLQRGQRYLLRARTVSVS
jgi:hypothetical protein